MVLTFRNGGDDQPSSPASGRQVAASKAIQRRTGATFHLATRLLPGRVRRATYVLYAFFRITDDVVDDPAPLASSEQRSELERIRAVAKGTRSGDDAVLAAFRDVAARYRIPDREVDAFVDAMLADVDASDYETYDDLETYLRGSSVAVGNMLLAVMDPDDVERARPHARALAEAFQLTNFVRDVREDVREYDRVYLPASTLAERGLTTDDVRALEPTPPLRRAVRRELRRTESLYRRGVAGIETLPADCQFAVLLAATLYAEHHRLVRARNFDVFTHRPSLSRARRLRVLARTWLAWQRFGDPEAAFYRASPVAREPGEPTPVRDDRSVGSGRFASLRNRTSRPFRTLGSVVSWVGK